MDNSIIKFLNLLSDKKSDLRKGEIYIFTIAIDDYDKEDNLNYCKRDSEYLIEVILKKSVTQIKRKNIYKLYDKDATKINIYEKFRQLNRILTPQDQLILHVAGHTTIEFNTNFIIPSDGDKNDIYTNISSSVLKEIISNIIRTTCILIFNSYNETEFEKLKYKENINERQFDILNSKYSIYSELINFLETSEKNVNKSIWHFTKSAGKISRSNEPLVVIDDSRELKRFLEKTKLQIDNLINKGHYDKALENIITISRNNDIRLKDQAEALLYYLKEKGGSRELVRPIEPVEAKGITMDLVHQIHESGYYLVPSPNLLKESRRKSKPKTILFSSADTADQDRLRLDEEYRAINLELLRCTCRDEFELIPCLSSRISDLQRELLNNDPYIVHFTGHGSCKGILMVADETGTTQLINNEPLGNLFKLFSHSIKCVFLNSCHSSSQSTSIGEHIENVVCMSSAVYDETAIKFASAFYMSLGSGKSISFSFEFAKNSIDLHGCPDKDLPILITKKTA